MTDESVKVVLWRSSSTVAHDTPVGVFGADRSDSEVIRRATLEIANDLRESDLSTDSDHGTVGAVIGYGSSIQEDPQDPYESYGDVPASMAADIQKRLDVKEAPVGDCRDMTFVAGGLSVRKGP